MKQEIKQRIEQIKNGEVPQDYKKTKIGIFPNEWEVCRAKKIFKNVSDKNHNGELEVLSVTQDRGVIPRSHVDIDIKYDLSNVVNYKKVERGDFVISLRSFQGGIEYSDYTGLVSPAYTVLKNTRDIKSMYYKMYFKSDNYIKQLNVAVYGIRDGKQISYDDFGFIEIPYPPLNEQQKISQILSTQDKVIELKEKLLKEKEKQKKYLMQNILTGRKRLKGFDGEWKKVKLGELCKIKTGKLDANAMVDNGKYPFFTCAKQNYFINDYAFDTEAILISGNGANVGYVHYYKGKFNAYQRTYVLDNFTEEVFYLKHFLDNNLSIRIDKEKNQGNTPYIVLSTLTQMKILLPPLEEQKAIAEILTTADKELKLLQEELEEEKRKKKALMQLLLTGIVRVTN